MIREIAEEVETTISVGMIGEEVAITEKLNAVKEITFIRITTEAREVGSMKDLEEKMILELIGKRISRKKGNGQIDPTTLNQETDMKEESPTIVLRQEEVATVIGVRNAGIFPKKVPKIERRLRRRRIGSF